MKGTKMSGKGRTNDNIERKITATVGSLPKLNKNHIAITKSNSASTTKPVQSKAVPNNRPATASVSSPSTSQVPKREPPENTNDMRYEVNKALEKYQRSVMSLPEPDAVSASIEAQLAALRERLHVGQLLMESTRKQMENISFQEEGGADNSEKDPHKIMEIRAGKLSSGIGQYQKTMNETMNVLEKLQMMNDFHDSSRLKRNVHWRKEEEE